MPLFFLFLFLLNNWLQEEEEWDIRTSYLCFMRCGLQPIELSLGVMPLSLFYEFSCKWWPSVYCLDFVPFRILFFSNFGDCEHWFCLPDVSRFWPNSTQCSTLKFSLMIFKHVGYYVWLSFHCCSSETIPC